MAMRDECGDGREQPATVISSSGTYENEKIALRAQPSCAERVGRPCRTCAPGAYVRHAGLAEADPRTQSPEEAVAFGKRVQRVDHRRSISEKSPASSGTRTYDDRAEER